jgi:hypothetical protein
MGAPSPLRDPARDFLNRTAEKRAVRAFYHAPPGTSSRCMVVHATRDVGVTFFLQHLEKTADARWFTVYADCSSSDPEVIFRRFFERLDERTLLRWRALSLLRELGQSFIQLLTPLMVPAPVGPAMGSFVGAVLPKVATTPYSSVASERFAKLITSGRWQRPVLFLVDNAQEIKPQSLHVLNTVFAESYAHVRIVLSFVANGDGGRDFEAFRGRLHGFGLGVETLAFLPPNEDFVGRIARALNVTLTPGAPRELLRNTDGKISRILTFLRTGGALPEPLPSLPRELLRYLLIAGQPLRRSDVLALVLGSPRIAAGEGEFARAIDALASRQLVVLRPHWLGDEMELAPGQARAAREAVPPVADLVAAEELYRYFMAVHELRSPNHSQSAYAALLYKLSKQVDPASVPQRAFDLVRISLEQADLAAAEHYIRQVAATSPSRSVADLYTLLAFDVSVQEYGRALRTLDEMGADYWQGVRTLRIIHAIALNRVRAHAQSGAEIDTLLAEPQTTDEEFALLTSYRVAGLLHEGEAWRARQLFERGHQRIRLAHNRGYALRNCAAVYFWGTGRDVGRAAAVLDEATAAFHPSGDGLGLYTTLNNRGALTGSGHPPAESAARALPAFQEAFEKLALFGTQHLEEVGANLGTALLLTGQTQRSATHLRKVAGIASFDFPKVLMESALAFCEVLSAQGEAARERMRGLTDRVGAVQLPEATYRANVNAAAIEAAAGGNERRLARYLDAAAECGYWGGGSSLQRVRQGMADGRITTATLRDYLSYDYFQYWSQNPLSVLASPVLPEQAERHHVLH